MGCFKCKKYHARCHASCCGVVPLPLKLWEKKKHLAQREVVSTHMGKNELLEEDFIVPVTTSFKCPFLKDNYECAIYEDRPDICKKFGDESHPLMCCPMQDKHGKPK